MKTSDTRESREGYPVLRGRESLRLSAVSTGRDLGGTRLDAALLGFCLSGVSTGLLPTSRPGVFLKRTLVGSIH